MNFHKISKILGGLGCPPRVASEQFPFATEIAVHEESCIS